MNARSYQGSPLFSAGFRPFFLLGSLHAGLAILIWLPVFTGELRLVTAFVPRDWHVHELLYGYLPAVITGFLFTAIPNWTGRLPLRGRPLILLVALWLAGRFGVTFSAGTGWLAAMLIDAAFLFVVAAAAAREIIAGRKWNNLGVVALVALLFGGNVAFHLEAHFNGTAETGIRVGIAVVVLLISLIGGRIIPSFTRNWLVRENPGRLPVPFARFDMLTVAASAIALLFWIVQPDGTGTGVALAVAGAMHTIRLGRWAGDRTARERLLLILHIGYAFVPSGLSAGRGGRLWPGAGRCGNPRLDGRRRGRHDACGDEPGLARPYRAAAEGVGGDAGYLRRDHHRRGRPNLCGPGARPQPAVAASRGIGLGGGVSWICGQLRPDAGRLSKACVARPQVV